MSVFFFVIYAINKIPTVMIIIEYVTGLLEKRFIFINQLNIVLKLLSAFILLLCLLLIIILLQSFPIVILVLILQIILKNNLIIKAFKLS